MQISLGTFSNFARDVGKIRIIRNPLARARKNFNDFIKKPIVNLENFHKYDGDLCFKFVQKQKNTQNFYCGVRGGASTLAVINDFSINFLLRITIFPQTTVTDPCTPVKLYGL